MTAPSSPAPTRRSARRGSSLNGTPPGDRASYANPGMRVSDAERAEVAERLSRHYGDGRLDEEEFNRRLDQAMSATTQADLGGLFADLPDHEPGFGEATADRSRRAGTTPPRPTARRHGGRPHRLLTVLLVIVAAIIVGHALSHWFIPWFLIGAIVLAWLWLGQRRRR
jgi:hypothetical protein